MKATLIWDVHVLFYSVDDEFKQFLFKRWHLHTGAEEKEENVREAMEAYFGPVATVAANMEQLGRMLNYITTEDGFYIVFRKFSEQMYMAVSKEEGVSEHMLLKRICVLYRVVSFLFGPVTKRVCPDDVASREAVWRKLEQIMECYDHLYQDDLTFLLEAVEYLSFASQLTSAEMKKACSLALDAAMVKNVSHAMLIVNNKMAMLRSHSRSSASQPLSSIDQLLIILLCNYYNGSPSPKPSDTASSGAERIGRNIQEDTPPPDTPSNGLIPEPIPRPAFVEVAVEREAVKEVEETDRGAETGQFPGTPSTADASSDQDGSSGDLWTEEIPIVTPTAALQSTERGTPLVEGEGSDKEDTLQPTQVDLSMALAQEQNDPSEPSGTVGYERSLAATGGGVPTPKGIKQTFMTALFGPKNEDFDGASSDPSGVGDAGYGGEDQASFQGDDSFLHIVKYNKEVVFIRRDVPYSAGVRAILVPCMLHFMSPAEEVALAIVEELPGASLATSICLSISHLEDFSVQPTEGVAKNRMEHMDQMIKSIVEFMKKQKAGQKVRQTVINISSTWTTLKGMNLLQVLQEGFPAQGAPTERLRNIMENLSKMLVSLFEMVFILSEHPSLSDDTIMKIIIRANAPLALYSGILAMKGLENIPLATDHAEDLVYYVFIDRKNNRVIAPSIACPGKTGNAYLDDLANQRGLKAGMLLKEKVWTFVNRVQRLLMNGFTSQIWLDDTFHYCYFLLLYHPSDEEEPLKVAEIKGEMDTPPGELTGSFFRRLRHAEDYMFSFEVFCLHKRTTPTSKAIFQSKRLVEKFVRTFSSNPVYGLLS